MHEKACKSYSICIHYWYRVVPKVRKFPRVRRVLDEDSRDPANGLYSTNVQYCM